MIVDKRVYTLRPGGIPTYLKVYEQYGLAPQSKHLGAPLGWFYSEIGSLNQITHLWGYDDLADRGTKRAAMQDDPDWKTFLKELRSADILIKQENELLIAAPWSPGAKGR